MAEFLRIQLRLAKQNHRGLREVRDGFSRPTLKCAMQNIAKEGIGAYSSPSIRIEQRGRWGKIFRFA